MDIQVDLLPPIERATSAKPLYTQIAEALHSLIRRGVVSKGDKIPPLVELAKHYDISRLTVRHAIQNLEAQGLLRSERGRGTFVDVDTAQPPRMKVKTTLDFHLSLYKGTDVEIIHSIKVDSCPWGIPSDKKKADAYQKMLRLHSKNGMVYGITDVYVDLSIFERAPEKFHNQTALRTVVQLCGKESLGGSGQRVTVGKADAQTAKYLNIPVGDPVVHARRITYDTNGVAVCIGDSVYRGEQVEMDIEFTII